MALILRRTTHRGALSNREGRYEPHTRNVADDGWGSDPSDAALPPLQTHATAEISRSILSRQNSPDIWFDRSLNPYRGCEHGCIYCFARTTHTRFGFSAGLDFESRLFYKPDAARLLEAELRSSAYRCAPLAMGTNTDPYQPLERKHEIVRSVLGVLETFRHPVSITTKSALVTRDIDILARMAADHLAVIGVSLTTLDRDLSAKMEPRASVPKARLKTIRALASAGVPVVVMIAPVIPGLTDWEMERILDAAADAGARYAVYLLLRLPGETASLFTEWLEAHYPERAAHILSLIRQTRKGDLSQSRFFDRFRGEGAYAALLSRRLELKARKLGLERSRPVLDTTLFRSPPQKGDQLRLFD